MRVKLYLFLIITFFSNLTSFSQTLDQDHLVGWSSLNEAVTFGQSFTAGLSGQLSQFDFRYFDSGAFNYNCELKIYSGTGTSGTLLKTQPFIISQNVPGGIAQITINNGPIVVSGATYSAVITVVSGGPPNGKMKYTFKDNFPHYMTGIVTESYPGGILLFNTSSLSQDLIFRTYVTPAPATHLNFDGVNDYLTLSNESSFDFTNQMTVEFWMNSNTTPAQWDALVTKGDDSWRIALTTAGKINFAVGGTSFGSVTSNASVIDGNWHHVAFTYNGSTAIIYIDGVQDASASGTGSMNNSAFNVAIGENLQATGRNYTGSMDEVRIWNIARSASQISGAKNCELAGTESGLIAYYKFNQGMGYVNNTSITSLTDASSNNNNGTFNGFALNGITSNFVTTDGFNAPSLPTLSAPVIFSQTNPASAVSASSGSLLWYTTATGGTSSTTPPTLTFTGNGSASYWISAINSRGCETTRVELVVVNAAAIPVNPTAVPIQLYKGNGTLANLTAAGTNLEWFSTSIGGTALGLSTVLVDNTTYYVSQSPQGVRSPRISVKVKKISASTQVFCSTTTVADLIATPSTNATAKWFSNSTDSTPLASSDAVSTGSLYVEQNIVSATTSIGTGFLKPEGIFVDASGSVYVADTENNAVKKMDSNGTTIQTIGSGFLRPLDVTVDALGNIYVFDSNLKGIVKMDSQGNNKTLIHELGGGAIVFNPGPPRLFTDRLGNIYLYYNYRIKKMDNNGGNVQEIFTTINGKTAMALDQLGNFYIVSGIELQKIDAVTGAVSILGSGFSNFYGIRNLVVDQLGTIYYTRNYDLTKINNDGTNIQVVASGVGNESGLSIDASGSIYVTTYNNTESVVKKYNPNLTSNRVAIAMSVETLAVPTFTTPVFIQGATATALTATSSGNALLWYTVATGGTGSTTAPTPSTAIVGTTSYWVSSTSNAGCESARVEMVVTVTLPATHLSFDGVNDFVNIGSVISAGASYTKEAMIKPNAITGNYNILSSAGDVFWISNNQIRAGHTSNFSHVLAPATLLLNAWNHVAVTYDAPSTTMKLYINGALVSTNTNVQATAGNAMQIGAYASVVPFNGSMDDVRIWNVARTQAQIAASKNCELQGNEPGLIAYYNFNQGTGSVSNTGVTSLINSVFGGANGTLQNFTLAGASSNWLAGSPVISGVVIPSAPTVTSPVTYFQNNTATALTATTGTNGTGLSWYTTAIGGTGNTTAPIPSTATVGTISYWVSSTNANGCESDRTEIVVTTSTPLPATHLNFDGLNDFVDLGVSATLKPTNAITVEFMAYEANWSSITNLATLIGNTQVGGYAVGVSGTNLSAVVRRNGTYATVLKKLSEISAGWHHFAFTYDNRYFKFYMDGILIDTNDAGANYNITYHPINSTLIGGESSANQGIAEANRYFNGSMDDVRIWNVARTQEQITASKNCELQGNESGLLAYYNFNQGNGSVSNTGVTSLINSVSGGANGTLQNFGLSGASSNWLSGSPMVSGVVIPSAPTAEAQTFCGSKTVADLVPASSTTIKWYTAATGGTVLLNTSALATGTYYVSESNSNGCESARTLVEVTVNLAKIWTGTTSTDWHTASNWCDNSVPNASSSVVIANTVNKPLIMANTEILNLEIQAGVKLNIANTLTVTQNIINEGQLIFKSNATSTGQLGVFNGTITGNGTATVERYIPAKRAWRALTAPLKGTNGSLYATWQNNGVQIPNVGAEIWGPSGTGIATGPGYSVLEYTPTGLVNVINTQTKNLFDTNKNNAYLMFVTGDYGSGNIASSIAATATTLSATGKLITGNVTHSNINDAKHNLIGNPYASALNPATLLDNTTNLIQKFWVWDPHSGTSGGYVMYDKAAGTYNNTTGSYPTGTTAVQSGQGFFVKATTGNTGSITLIENNKSSAVTNSVFSTNIPEIFRLGMYRQEAQNWLPLDGAIAVMYPSANPEVDVNDGVKFANSSENIAFRRSNTSLSSEHHLPLVANDVLYIKVWNTTPNMYKLRLNTESFDATNLDAKLQDLYTNVDTVLNLEGSINEYLFNVTSDVASTNDRFRIVFQAKGALSTNESNKNPFIIAPNPVTNQIVTVYFKDNQFQKLKYTLVNALGQLIAQGNVNADNTINVANVATGMYVLQLQTENNEIYTSKLIIK